MKNVAFFASPTLVIISQNVIANLLYDISLENAFDFNKKAIEDIFFESITEGAKNIIKSPQTKRKLLSSLQQPKLKRVFENFHKNGKPLEDEYFVKQFSTVISPNNAQKVVSSFLESFRMKIAAKEELATSIIATYSEHIKNGDWQLGKDGAEELKFIFEQKNGKHSPSQISQTDETIFLASNGHWWEQHHIVLPVRGLRKMESQLIKNPLLYITGIPGSGKSVLISTFIDSLHSNQIYKENEILYFRFREGICNYESFTKSIEDFLNDQGLPDEDEEFSDELTTYISRFQGLIVLDDFQFVVDEKLLGFVHKIWGICSETENLKGQFIILDRRKPENLQLNATNFFHYQGLSNAESNALLRDKWALNISKKVIGQLSKKLMGNPQLMIVFRNWWLCESHTDTEIERYVAFMPNNEEDLSKYIIEHLYDSFERIDSRFNSFLKAASVFSIGETEEFLEQTYDKIGGGDFQYQLEKLVDEYEILSYDEKLSRYHLNGLLREFYGQLIQSVQIKRILHNCAGQLYRQRFEKSQEITDVIEGARHFRIGEREEDAVNILKSVMQKNEIGEYYTKQILEIIEGINIELFDNLQSQISLLYNRGKFYLQKGLLKLAESDLTKCQTLTPSESKKGSILVLLSNVASQKGKLDQAFQLLEEALKIYKKLKNKLGIAEVYSLLAAIHIKHEDYAIALDLFEKAQIIYDGKSDLKGTLQAYNNMGWIHKQQKEWDLALKCYQESLNISKKLQDLNSIADSFCNLGQIKENTGEWDETIGFYYKEMRLREKMDDWGGAAKTYLRIGSIYRKRMQWDNAMEFYQESQEIFEKSEDWYGLAKVYTNIGEVHYGKGEWELAMGLFQKSQELFQKIQKQEEYASTFFLMALVYRAMEEWERALDMYDKALEIKEKLNDSAGVAEIYRNIGDIYRDQGEKDYALEVYFRSISMKEELNDQAGISQIYFTLGEIYKNEQDWEKGTEYYKKSLEKFNLVNDVLGSAKAYRALGFIQQAQKNPAETKSLYLKALELFQKVDNPEGIANVNYNLGNVLHDMGELEEALNRYSDSLPMFERSDDFYNFAQTLGNISSIEFERKDHTEAINKQVEILLYFQNNDQKELVERVLSNLVACHEELGPNTFQALLNSCLERITQNGIKWGEHQILIPEKAGKMISEIFYNS